MPNQIFRGLVWSSPAGVLAQAVELAARSDGPNHKHEIKAGANRSVQKTFRGKQRSLPSPVAAIALVLLGCVVGTTLVVAFIS
jgi:hypothetical protein